jgi:chromosome segregation ATPase
MPRSPQQELAAAEQALTTARNRLAENRRRRRDLTLQGNELGDAISRELWQAGRDAREPDIAGQRARIAEITAELADLDRVENGIEAAVTDAQNAVAHVTSNRH